LNAFHPSATVDGDRLRVVLLDSEPVRSIGLDCVVDLTDMGEIVGIEVLDVQRQLGGGVMPPAVLGELRWSFDDEMDAFYLQVAQGRGQIQKSAKAIARLDSTQHVVQFDIPVPRVG
jgi:hypothetical protein